MGGRSGNGNLIEEYEGEREWDLVHAMRNAVKMHQEGVKGGKMNWPPVNELAPNLIQELEGAGWSYEGKMKGERKPVSPREEITGFLNYDGEKEKDMTKLLKNLGLRSDEMIADLLSPAYCTAMTQELYLAGWQYGDDEELEYIHRELEDGNEYFRLK